MIGSRRGQRCTKCFFHPRSRFKGLRKHSGSENLAKRMAFFRSKAASGARRANGRGEPVSSKIQRQSMLASAIAARICDCEDRIVEHSIRIDLRCCLQKVPSSGSELLAMCALRFAVGEKKGCAGSRCSVDLNSYLY